MKGILSITLVTTALAAIAVPVAALEGNFREEFYEGLDNKLTERFEEEFYEGLGNQ